jgi:DNA (cytosine-5)-methyltransferase 1
VRFLSLFSGIEAASAAWLPLGWQCVGVAEIEPFACAVLASRYPDVPNLGDVLAPDFLQRASALRPDVLVGGPPCQDFSIAGLRAGLDGARGNLSLRWVEVVRAIRPTYAVTENVPGWLSVNRGHAFGAFLAGLVGHDTALVPPKSCGGRWTDAGMVDGPDGRVAWRILDAQYFGLAQRRRRVFAVHCPRGGADPAAVLFEPAGLCRDTPARGEAREGVTGTLSSRATAGGGLGTDFDCSGGLVANTLRVPSNGATWRGDGADNLVTHSLRADGFDASEDGTGRGTPLVPVAWALGSHVGAADGDQTNRSHAAGGPVGSGISEELSYALRGGRAQSVALRGRGESHDLEYRQDGIANAVLTPNGGRAGIGVGAVAFPANLSGTQCASAEDIAPALGAENPTAVAFNARQVTSKTNRSRCEPGQPIGTLDTDGGMHVATTAAVRRLTPVECSRLQGFPDDYLDIQYRGRPAADGNKYRALGNSMAVPCVRWIGRAILAAEAATA